MKRIGTVTWLPERETQAAHEELTLLVHAMTIDREHLQACGGHAECGTCRVRIVSGLVTPITTEEGELLREFPESFRPGERLACQVRPLGDVVVELPAEELADLRDS